MDDWGCEEEVMFGDLEGDGEFEDEEFDEFGDHGMQAFDDLDDLDELDEESLHDLGGGIAAGVGFGDADAGSAAGVGVAAAAVAEPAGRRWSAWEVGTVFALGGALLDSHAEQVARQVRQELQRAGIARSHDHDHRRAPHPAPAHRYRYQPNLVRLAVGDPLDPDRLFRDLGLAIAPDRHLLIQAEGTAPSGGRLVLVISVLAHPAGPMMWVVAELHPGGFSASRLVPVFRPDDSGTMAVFATDYASQATDAVRFACDREGVPTTALTVTRRQP
jgi:hypothetical protein